MPGAPPSSVVDKITLDREVFKALASDTRLDILKALDVRQKTVTELAKELSLNKATVFEHLEKLAAVGLIQKLEDERKWVYWQLTWTGRRLLHPEKITLALLLSSAMGTLLTALAAAWMWTRSNLSPAFETGREASGEMDAMKSPEGATTTSESAPPPESAEGARSLYAADGTAPADPATVPPPDVVHDPVFLAIAVVMLVVFLALAGYALYYWRRRRIEAASESGAASL